MGEQHCNLENSYYPPSCQSDLKNIVESLKDKGVPVKLKTLYDRLEGKYDYHKLRLAIAHFRVNFGERGVVRYD